MSNQLSQLPNRISNSYQRFVFISISVLITLVLISCGDFINKEEEQSPHTQTPTEEPKSQELELPKPKETTETPTEESKPEEPELPKPKETPETPKQLEGPKPKPVETKEQSNWRLCEAERLWAFNARIIDSNALRLYQSRNFAPVFKNPGERQSGIEGWYPCARALEMNGFIESDNF